MSNYFIELAAIHAALIVAYWLLLRKEVQYAQMRSYLIGATLISVVVPLLKLPTLFPGTTKPVQLAAPGEIAIDSAPMATVAQASNWGIELLVGIYIAITAFFLFKFARNFLFMIRLERGSTFEKYQGHYIRRVPGLKGSFTFFHWIFLGEEIDKGHPEFEAILDHESAHATLGHTYDLLFLELFKACFWWLPTAWFTHQEIKKIHEYQADALALRSYDVDQYSSILISSILKSNGLSLASSFHDGLIFKRLQAMKRKVKNVSPWKVGTLAALGATLFIAFACTEEPVQQLGADDEVFTIVEERPQYEAGMDAFYKHIMGEVRYPKEARQSGTQGKVFVQFVVQRDGSVTDVQALKGIGAGCDQEVVRVLETVGSFKPAKQRGRAVRTRMILPVIFKINDEAQNPDNSPSGMVILEEIFMKKDKFTVEYGYDNGEWFGTIYDPAGEKLPGTNIVVPGTTRGTVSGLDGKFRLKAEDADELVVSFVGFETMKLTRAALEVVPSTLPPDEN